MITDFEYGAYVRMLDDDGDLLEEVMVEENFGNGTAVVRFLGSEDMTTVDVSRLSY